MTDLSFAQATRTWVSGVGDDANPCSRTAPCKTFAGAISKTAAGGEINAIDPGGFGAVTITKAITIDTSNTVGGVLNALTNGIIVNAGAADVVVLRGLDIDSTPSSAGLNGVRFIAGGALHIEDSIIRDNNGSGTNGFGILFAPSTGSPELFVINTTITGNGTSAGSSGSGLQVAPTGSAGAVVAIDRSHIDNNGIGIRIDGTATTGAIKVTVSNSTSSGNTNNGINAVGGGAIAVMLDNVVFANNTVNGVRAAGSSTIIRLGRSTVSGNQTGLAVVSGGQIQSYENNLIDGNGTNGTPTSIIPMR